MGVTRRYWGEVGVVVVLVGAAVLFARPVLLVGAGGVAGWLLAQQYAFVRAVSDVADGLSVAQSPTRDAIRVEDEVTVVLDAELARPAPVTIELEANLPVGVEVVEGESAGKTADGFGIDDGTGPDDKTGPDARTETGHETATSDATSLRASLALGERAATTAFSVRSRLAGAFEFDRPTLTATDETGRFRTKFPVGPSSGLTVNPRGPTNVHVGIGGESLEAPYGEYASNERGPGLELAEIRAYVPGDEVNRIDWNATARLGQPHVREFETTTERRTALLVDCRPSMGDGPDGETKFDYARQVALAVVGHARARGDPVSLYAVGEGGLLVDQPSTATEDGYATCERRLRALEPEREGEPAEPSTDGPTAIDSPTARDGSTATHSPATARRRADRLRSDGSAFAAQLEPFFADADPYVERVTDDPLYRTARTRLDRLSGAVTTVVLTDDARPTETREVVKVARRRDDHVLAFLTPTALFDRETDLEAAYDRYADFERFRRELANLDRVSAYEVGPGDRLDALLAANRTRRRAEAGD